jgi:hypothetical protein
MTQLSGYKISVALTQRIGRQRRRFDNAFKDRPKSNLRIFPSFSRQEWVFPLRSRGSRSSSDPDRLSKNIGQESHDVTVHTLGHDFR